MPVYNEESTIVEALRRVLSVPSVTQVIVVDDGSTDSSLARARKIAARDSRIEILCHLVNRGKGAAVRSAIPRVREPVVVTQDADLECDPRDLPLMLDRFLDPKVHVVYGVREASVRRAWNSLYGAGSWLITWVANRLYGACLADEPTCYKMLRSGLLRRLSIESRGFEYCPEVTAKTLLLGFAIHEVPIRYTPRTRKEGKKIRLRDGLVALWTLVRLRVGAVRLPG